MGEQWGEIMGKLIGEFMGIDRRYKSCVNYGKIMGDRLVIVGGFVGKYT